MVFTDTEIPVMEHFYTLQGEGAHAGKAAYFIRIGGCDVGCSWCDVKESWDSRNHKKLSIQELKSSIKDHHSNVVVITGGEPLMYNLDYWTSELKRNNLNLHLETSGAYQLSGRWDWICVSPKKFKKPTKECLSMAHELKVIIYNKHDFQWAEENSRLVNKECQLYLQPEWDKKEKMNVQIVEYIKKNPKWRVSVQSHKYLNIP